MILVWDEQKTYQLIELIDSSLGLRNFSLKDYRDRQLKAKCLETIALTIEIRTAEVGKNVHNLRCHVKN